MIHYCTVYHIDTGEIVSSSNFSINNDLDQIAKNYLVRVKMYGLEDHDFIEAESDSSIHYVSIVQGVPLISSRPNLLVNVNKTTIVANGSDSIVLSGLPIPCEMTQDPGEPEEQSFTVTGGGFVFTAENPGTYQFRIERFPFLPLDLEFTAT